MSNTKDMGRITYFSKNKRRIRSVMVKLLIRLSIVVIFVGCVYYHYQLANTPISESFRLKKETEIGITHDEIIIGSSAPLTGQTKQLGIDYITYGLNIAIQEFNDAGGVFGRKIRLIAYDDGYEPDKTVANTEKLIKKDKVFALAGYVGTPTTIAAVPIITKEKTPLVGIFAGTRTLRTPVNPYIFNIRASYDEEYETIIRYFVDNLGLTKIGVFYQENPTWYLGVSGVQNALARRNLTIAATSTFKHNTSEVDEGARVFASSSVEAIIMIGGHTPIAKFIHLVREVNPNIKYHAISFVGPDALAQALTYDDEHNRMPEDHSHNIFVTQVVPPPYYTDIYDGLARYRDVLHKYYPNVAPTYSGLEGYIAGRVLTMGIEGAGKNITRESFASALEHIKNKDISIGETLSFSENSHQAMNKVFLTTLIDGEYVIVPVK